MQTLEYQNAMGEEIKKEFEIPKGMTGVGAKVRSGKETVELTIDGRTTVLTVAGARDLALALRREANRIEREMMDRLGKAGRAKKRR